MAFFVVVAKQGGGLLFLVFFLVFLLSVTFNCCRLFVRAKTLYLKVTPSFSDFFGQSQAWKKKTFFLEKNIQEVHFLRGKGRVGL